MRTIDTSVVIEASPGEVWAVLTDFARYEEWNPFILRARGEAVVGGRLQLFIRPPGEKGMTHRPAVLVAEPGRHLRWLGRVAVPGVLAAEHEFVLEAVPGGTRVRHREAFTGLLVPLLGRTIGRAEEGFARLNRALKERVEARAGTS